LASTEEVPPYRYRLFQNQRDEWKVEILKGEEVIDELRFGSDCTRENVEFETEAWIEYLKYKEEWTPAKRE